MNKSGNGRGSIIGFKGKEKENGLAVAHRERLLSSMQGKRSYQAAISALDAHYADEEEKDENGTSSRCDGYGEGELGLGEKVVSTGSHSRAAVKEEKIETLRDKRRKIKERGERLDASLAEESSRLTGILERVATALVPATGTSDPPTGQPSDVQMPTEPEKTETRFKSLETRLGTAEEALEEVKGNTVEILKILQQK